jgi:hypothetical protein
VKEMDKRIARIAKDLGAQHVGTLPETGGGAFGMARLAQLIHSQLVPSMGKRPGRPTNEKWTERCKVPMSTATLASLNELSARLSTSERKVSPMQVAAELLEQGLLQLESKQSKQRRARKSSPREHIT